MTSDAAVDESKELKEADGSVDSEQALGASEKSVHWIQKFYDNPWILLVLGILIPFLSYTVWGWIDLAMIEPAELP